MLDFIEQIAHAWQETFLWAVIQNTIFLGILFFILNRIKNASANVKYWIAVIGYFKCLLPPFLPAYFFPQSQEPIVLTEMNTVITTPPPPPEPSALMIDWQTSLFLFWTISVLIVLLIPVVSTIKLYRQLKKANLLKHENINGKYISVYKSDKVSVPFSTGIFKPKIYVPVIWESWTLSCRQMILKHEVAHIRRGDAIIRILQTVTRALYFFHPLIWVLSQKVHDYREMACDDTAVQREKAVSVEYAKALVQIAEDLVQSNVGCASASALIKQKTELLNRVKYQMEGTMKNLSKRTVGLILGLMILLIIPLSWSKSKVKTEDVKLGKIWGTVTDTKTGEKLYATNITIRGTKMGAAADNEGKYLIVNVPEGTYSVNASRMGYGSVTMKNVSVKHNKSTTVDFQLQQQVIDFTSIKDKPEPKQEEYAQSTPPPVPDDEEIEFVPYDEPPQPVDGFFAIQEHLVYPEAAKKAGIEGRVIIYTQINEQGNVVKTKVHRSVNSDCDNAAINAIKAVKWQPAMQRDLPVKVWISIPVQFSLRSYQKKDINILIKSKRDIELDGESTTLNKLEKQLDQIKKDHSKDVFTKIQVDPAVEMSTAHKIFDMLKSRDLNKISFTGMDGRSLRLMLPPPGTDAKMKKIPEKNKTLLLVTEKDKILLDNKSISKPDIQDLIKNKLEENPHLIVSVAFNPKASAELCTEIMDELKKANAKRIYLMEGE